jgi:hypothetical protein
MALRHLANVEMQKAGNVFEILQAARDQRIGGAGFRRISPKNDNV